MPIAKAIPGNDVIEGSPVVLRAGGDLSTFIHDNADRVPHIADPTGSAFTEVVSGRFLSGDWAEERVGVASTSDISSPAASGEASVTYAAIPNQQHAIYGVACSYNGNTNGSGVLTVEAGSGNIVFTGQVASGASGNANSFEFRQGLRTTRSSAMIVRLTGVSGVRGQVSVTGHRME